MDGSQVGVLEERDKVGLAGLLQRTNSGRLSADVGLEVLGNLTNKTLERQLADQKFRALLVATNLTQSHGTRLVTVGLLHCRVLVYKYNGRIHTTTSGGGRLTSGLSGELLTGRLATS